MTFIPRHTFEQRFQHTALNTHEARYDPRLADVDLAAADLNHDGQIHGAQEGGALFDAIDRLDGDSDRSTIRMVSPDGRPTAAADRVAAVGDRIGAFPAPSTGPMTTETLSRNADFVLSGRAIDADELRGRYGIPGPGASGMDGFRARSLGRTRPVGLLRRGSDGTPRMSVESSARTLAGTDAEASRASVVRQLNALDELDPNTDRALVMSVAMRESGTTVLSPSRRPVDTFSQGGLDHLAAHVGSGRIRPPEGYGPWRPGERTTNELGRPAQGALVPENELLMAYGLELRASRQRFEEHVREVFPENADQMLRDMSPEAARAWTSITFGAPNGAHYRPGQRYGSTFGARTALEMLRHQGGQGRAIQLEDVLTDERLNRYTVVQRGRVSAAEAESYERTLTEGSQP